MQHDSVHYLGIRHHGPGSSASLQKALEQLEPDHILLEGAPEAQTLLSYIGHAQLCPPVAQLIYCPDNPKDSVFYPFTRFSPEWQALCFAQSRDIPIEFIDLPQTHSLALSRQAREEQPSEESEEQDLVDSLSLPRDPLDLLAEAAGFQDGELWWEHVVEQHHAQGLAVFQSIAEAMSAVRECIESEQNISHREQLREAWMRKCIRNTKRKLQKASLAAAEDKDTHIQAEDQAKEPCIVVVCGAWHVPALIKAVTVKHDNALLKGLPKVKTKATWIPWSYSRISYHSGYGAGVNAPGWYDHLWQFYQKKSQQALTSATEPQTKQQQTKQQQTKQKQQTQAHHPQLSAQWLTRAARLLRDKGVDVPPANVIEAVRLAETLAALREKHQPDLQDMNEAIQTLYCHGDSTPLALIQEHLLVGDHLGRVPEDLPQTPLQEDFQRHLKSLRLKTSTLTQDLTLDLRKDIGLQRSQLFHQLNILNIPWGSLSSHHQGKGTFKEVWQLQWQPDYDLNFIERGFWGNTIADAAHAYALNHVQSCTQLEDLVQWIHHLLLAHLTSAVSQAVQHLQDLAANESHILSLMQALPSLVKIVRYGDVRGTDSQTLQHVIEHFITRICIGLPQGCLSLDDESAAAMSQQLSAVDQAIKLLKLDAQQTQWLQCLQKLSAIEQLPCVIVGKSYRLLVDAQVIDTNEVSQALSLALSKAQEPAHAAAWIEGLLGESGLILVHDDQLWSIIDNYLAQLGEAHFISILPLLRRTFASFAFGERQNLLLKAQRSAQTNHAIAAQDTPSLSQALPFDHSLVESALAFFDTLLFDGESTQEPETNPNNHERGNA